MKKSLLVTFAVSVMMIGTAAANAQNHEFAGSYVMNNFYVDYITEDMSMDDLPLVINEENQVTNFANYTPITTITGEVEGNEFTLTTEDEHMILDIDWDTFHYLILNGETFGDEYEYAPITLSYNPETESYEMSSWMLWDYDLFNGTYEKIGYCMMFGVQPGEVYEDVDYTGEYTVTGLKTVYVDGVAQEPVEDEFVMALRPDDGNPGFYEFTQFAGYEVGLVPKGWLGVYGAVYAKDIELQGVDIELNEDGDGIKLAGPFEEYDSMYTVTIFFEGTEEGKVSDFDVWRMENGEAVELLAKWSYLTFTKGVNTGAIHSIGSEVNNATDAPVFYDLQGHKVMNPSNGIFILRQGDKVKKVMIRK